MAEMCDQKAGENPQRQVKSIEHPGQNHPEDKHDQKSGKLGHLKPPRSTRLLIRQELRN
jgi:hypothetical protein